LVVCGTAYASLPEFTAVALEGALKAVAKELGVKNGVLVHPLRLACTGATAGPSLYHLMEVLERDRVLARLDRAFRLAAVRRGLDRHAPTSPRSTTARSVECWLSVAGGDDRVIVRG
jgi:hypothetical protein